MKKLVYKILGHTDVYDHATDRVEQLEVLISVETEYTEVNLEIAKRDAYNGEYTVVDDGQPESETTDDVLNALLGVTV